MILAIIALRTYKLGRKDWRLWIVPGRNANVSFGAVPGMSPSGTKQAPVAGATRRPLSSGKLTGESALRFNGSTFKLTYDHGAVPIVAMGESAHTGPSAGT